MMFADDGTRLAQACDVRWCKCGCGKVVLNVYKTANSAVTLRLALDPPQALKLSDQLYDAANEQIVMATLPRSEAVN